MNQVIWLGVAGCTDKGLFIGLEGEAIAAGENTQGAQSIKGGCEVGQPMPPCVQIHPDGVLRQFCKLVESRTGLTESGLAEVVDTLCQAVEVHGDFAAIGDCQLAGLAGRQGASVRGEVGQCHINLVAHGRDNW